MSIRIALSLLVLVSTTSAMAQRRPRPMPRPDNRSCTLEARIQRSFNNPAGIGYSIATGAELLRAAGAGVDGTRLVSATLHVQADYDIITAFKFDVQTTVGVPSGPAVSIPASRRAYPARVDVSSMNFVLGARERVVYNGRNQVIDANGELEAGDLDFNITGSGYLMGATIVAQGPGCR